MYIEKEKLPKGMSYPLKSSVLEKAFLEAEISVFIHLKFVVNRYCFFSADYWLPNQNVDYDRFYIGVGAVNYADAREVRKYMESQAIPDLTRWAREIVTLPSNSPKLYEKPYFRREFKSVKREL